METAAGLPRAARSRLELHRRSLSTAGDVLRSAVHSDGGVTGVVDATAVSREFRSRGFVAVRQLLPEGHVDALRSALQAYMATSDENSDPRSGGQMRYYEGTPDERGPHTLKYIGFKEFNHLPEDNPALRSLRELPLHQDLEDLARACLSTPVDHPSRTLTYATRWLDKPPVRDRSKRSATPAHQDSFYFVGRQEDCAHAQQLAKTELPRLCSFWIALDHVDEENGCLRYRPYSHMRGLLPHRPGGPLGFSQQLSVDSDEMRLSEFHPGPRENNRQRHRADPAEVSLSLAPGDCVLHDGCTVHRADANQSSTRHRRALGVVYRAVPKGSHDVT
jgi:hypothetical protein